MNLSWVQNPLFTLSGWLIGVAGLIAAFYYGIKGKSKKEKEEYHATNLDMWMRWSDWQGH